ncbi:RNA polymerase, sigma 28 subunit, SigD/FliA/WhiG [Nocardioides exalbidus]|uniref:RNA polymerase, sigma 28 subunit, SigD/FliA/WhiG n=1 Tax=Nocardioides exalbidus TaxID=402596 RepID=A0A1H4Y810_9ACTN|nr:RNA polymerase, sigma 28 subunit, SigD/FliA/WhiG [Nocardioides exalbidus]
MVPVSLVCEPQTPSASLTARQHRQQRTDAIAAELRHSCHESVDRAQLVDDLISTNIPMARALAARYRNRGVDLDDLEQVAMIGLVKAARRFDADAGHDFMSFAVPTVRGELRRHFRDFGWTIRPPRRIQELQSTIGRARLVLEQRWGRAPRPSELAAHLDVDVRDVEEALAVDGCFTPTSLDGASGSTAPGDVVGDWDGAFDAVDARVVLAPVMGRISARDRRILLLRFYEQRSQQEIADAVGLTQTSVSRVLTRILRDLHRYLVENDAAA